MLARNARRINSTCCAVGGEYSHVGGAAFVFAAHLALVAAALARK